LQNSCATAPSSSTASAKAAEDVELAGVRIPAGTLVGANTASANRDPGVYAHPDRLDITRHGQPPMLTFGGGVPYCLGAHPARLELTESLRVITRRMPNARPTGSAPWPSMSGITRPTTVPLEFDVTTVVSHDELDRRRPAVV
jgi:cytochrome P450